MKLQETLDLDSLAELAESIKKVGLKASLTAGELTLRINFADILLG